MRLSIIGHETFFNSLNEKLVEIGFKLKITYSNTIIKVLLFNNFKLIGNGEFNFLNIILIEH